MGDSWKIARGSPLAMQGFHLRDPEDLVQPGRSTSSTSISSEDMSEGWDGKLYPLETPGASKFIPGQGQIQPWRKPTHSATIVLDPSCRGDLTTSLSDTPGDFTFSVLWTNEGFGKVKVNQDHLLPLTSDSETDEEIQTYIQELEVKRAAGENVSGETLWYDPERSMVRNLHRDSVSLTGYGQGDELIFGKTQVFLKLMTPEERKMITVPEPEEESQTAPNDDTNHGKGHEGHSGIDVKSKHGNPQIGFHHAGPLPQEDGDGWN